MNERLLLPQDVELLPKTTGITVAVFNELGEIVVVEEKKTRGNTGKNAGQLTTPVETLKEHESGQEALYGVMAEVTGWRDYRKYRDFGLTALTPEPYFPDHVTENGTQLQEQQFFVRFDGPLRSRLHPTARNEVAFAGWMKPEELLESPRLRSVAVPAVSEIVNHLSQAMEMPVTPLFPSRLFRMGQRYHQRELRRDIPL